MDTGWNFLKRGIRSAAAGTLVLLAGGCGTFMGLESDPRALPPGTKPAVAAPVLTGPARPAALAERPAPRDPVVMIPRTAPVPPPVVRPPVAVPPSKNPVPPAPPVTPPDDGMSLVAIQAALDRLNFSPNCIDGTDGPQTRLAIEAWQIRQGVTPTGVLSPEQARQLVGETPPLTTRTVTAEDLASLGPTPSSWTGKASLERLAYGTLLEALAESAHARESLLRKLNPDLAWPNPPAGAAVRVPRSEDEMPQRTAARLTVSLRHKHIRAFDREGRLIAHFPCSIAAKVEKRPRGEARVTTAADGPNYTFDPALFSEDPAAAGIGRRLIIPPGPNNPVGVAWIGLNLPGYGIHGTPKPEEIGKTESHGCFRLANWNARRLLKLVEPGTPVEITD